MEFGDRDLSSAIARLTRGVEAGSTTPAVHWLGTRRGTDGVSLAASLDDLTTAVRVAAGLDPDPHELRAFALAWAEGALGALRTRGALDPETSLATREYLATRLRDLARLGVAPGSRLVVVGPGSDRHRLAVALRAARVADELTRSFVRAETPVQLAGDRIGAIVELDDAAEASLRGLRRALDRIDAAHERDDHECLLVALELPTAPDEVPAFLAGL